MPPLSPSAGAANPPLTQHLTPGQIALAWASVLALEGDETRWISPFEVTPLDPWSIGDRVRRGDRGSRRAGGGDPV
jgi:hypothetical protein